MRYPSQSMAQSRAMLPVSAPAPAKLGSGIQPLTGQHLTGQGIAPQKNIITPPGLTTPQSGVPKQGEGSKRSVSTVPAVLYEKVVAELEQARRKVLQLSEANRTLEHRNDALAQELQQVASELQGDIYRALTRLQVLAEAAELGESEGAGSQPASALVSPSASSGYSSYSFLDRLKSRQQESCDLPAEDPTVPDTGSAQSSAPQPSSFNLEEALDPFADLPALDTLPIPEPPRSPSPRHRSSRSRPGRGAVPRLNRYLPDGTWAGDPGEKTASTEPSSRPRRAQPSPPLLAEEVSPEEELFGTGIPDRDSLSKSRERQAAQQSLLIWGVLSLLLVTGCFTAGFFVVQSVVRGGDSNHQQR